MLQIVCQGAPDTDHPNEDAFIAYQRSEGQPRYILAAIDGATSVAFYEPLVAYLKRERGDITPAALAAAVTRDTILAQLGNLSPGAEINPRQLLLQANDALRTLLNRVAPGIYDAAAIRQHNPEHALLLDDPRKVRLFLPAAVATLAVIDTEVKSLYYAHAGDTVLILGLEDGTVQVPTRQRAAASYETALFAAVKQVAGQDMSLPDMLNHPLLQTLNRDSYIYHNYVSEEGEPHPERGVGVINGMPQLANYIKTGVVSLQGVEAIMVASDGFLWPDNPLDTQDDFMQRITRMWAHIRQHGAAHYLHTLRTEEQADFNRERYPRFKIHDDATGVVLNMAAAQ